MGNEEPEAGEGGEEKGRGREKEGEERGEEAGEQGGAQGGGALEQRQEGGELRRALGVSFSEMRRNFSDTVSCIQTQGVFRILSAFTLSANTVS